MSCEEGGLVGGGEGGCDGEEGYEWFDAIVYKPMKSGCRRPQIFSCQSVHKQWVSSKCYRSSMPLS